MQPLSLQPVLLGLLFLALAYGTRTAAMPLMAAACGVFAFRRQWRRLAVLAGGCLLFAGSWMVWAAMHKHGSSDIVRQYYTDYFAYQLRMVPLETIPRHVVDQIDHLVNAATTMLLVNFGDNLAWIFVKRILFAGAVSGIVRLMRQGKFVVYGWYALLYAGMLLVWYGPPEPRFLLPVLPLLVAGFVREMQQLAELILQAWEKGRVKARENRVAAVVMGAVMALIPLGMVGSARDIFAVTGPSMLAGERRQQAPLAEAYAWIRANTPKEQTFFTIDDPVFYLHTGRKALRSPELQKIFLAAKAGGLRPSEETLAVMERFQLGCLFVSAKHFDREPGEAPKLEFTVAGTGLEEKYRTATEVLACRQDLSARR